MCSSIKWSDEVSNWSKRSSTSTSTSTSNSNQSEKQSESAKRHEVRNAKWIKNKLPIKHKSIPISNQSATELRRQLNLQKINPEFHDRVVNLPIHLRGDLLESYSDVTLRCTIKKVLAVYLPKDGKEVDRIMENMLPANFKLKYSDSETYTFHYRVNKT